MKQSTRYQKGDAIGLAGFAATDGNNDADWVTMHNMEPPSIVNNHQRQTTSHTHILPGEDEDFNLAAYMPL